MRTGRNRDNESARVTYVRAERRKKTVSKLRTAGTSACERTSAYTQAWLKSFRANLCLNCSRFLERTCSSLSGKILFRDRLMRARSTEENESYEKPVGADRRLP